jgi:hypothetical protein
VLCAAEIVDAVTLEPVRTDIKVTADGLKRSPTVNSSGYHVWLEEGAAKPQRIVVDASRTEYADAEATPTASPQKPVRIELAPRYGYEFPQGATALRGTLLQSRFGARKPLAGARVRLQWSGDLGWVDAPTLVTTEENGDFAAPLRFAPKDKPVVANGALIVRLRVTRQGVTRSSNQFELPRGRVTGAAAPFAWDDLNP